MMATGPRTANRPQQPISASSRLEFISDISLPNFNSEYKLGSGTLPNDRFMYGLRISFEGRMTQPASGFATGFTADGIQSILENIKVEGYHKIRGQREAFFNLRGADVNAGTVLNSNGCNLLAGAQTITHVTNGTDDVRLIYDVMFVPANVPIAQQLGYLLDAPNYDALTLSIQYADPLSIYTGQTTPVAATAYGSASGNPKVRVSGLFSMGGVGKFAGFIPARIWRTYQEVVSGDVVNGNNGSRLFNLLKGYRIRSLLLKTGTKSTTSTAGNNSYATLSSSIASNIQIMQGINRPIRRYADMYSIQMDLATAYDTTVLKGYSLIDFAQRGHLWEALQTKGLVAGTSGDTDFYLQADIAAGAAQAAVLVTEEIRGYPKRV